jgi:hypothetical protein
VETADPIREQDPATDSLVELLVAVDECVTELQEVRRRAEALLDARRAGGSWLEIVSSEQRPLVVESISSVMATLARAGSTWRREEAHALRTEDVSINRIAAMFGVTRQRISALLRDRSADTVEEPSA